MVDRRRGRCPANRQLGATGNIGRGGHGMSIINTKGAAVVPPPPVFRCGSGQSPERQTLDQSARPMRATNAEWLSTMLAAAGDLSAQVCQVAIAPSRKALTSSSDQAWIVTPFS